MAVTIGKGRYHGAGLISVVRRKSQPRSRGICSNGGSCGRLCTRCLSCGLLAHAFAQPARVSISATEENTANTAGVLFGALGAMANVGYAVGRIRAERKAAYEKTMRACLTEKGYSLP